jgi:maltose O-acetyltransferase
MVGPGIWIGRSTYVGPHCHMYSERGGVIKIGESVDIGPGCLILTVTHVMGTSQRRAGPGVVADVDIGTGSWLGARVTVLPGCRLGPGCVVGAGTLLNSVYPPNSLVVGTPGRVVRTLEEDEED